MVTTQQTITITITKGEHDFTLHMPVGTSWGNAVDAAWDIAQHVSDMARQSMDASKPVTDEPSSVETEVIEPTLVEGV